MDMIVCTHPSNVLLVSGYWPVIGNAIAVAARDGAIGVLAPADEAALAAEGWADISATFEPGSLRAITNTIAAVRRPLAALMTALGRHPSSVGFEGASFDASGYASSFIYGTSIRDLFRPLCPDAVFSDATSCLAALRSTLTAHEIAAVRRAATIARNAFFETAARIRPGMREHEVAALLRRALVNTTHERCDGFAYCMSGPNAARAYAAFQQSTSRALEPGDCVLLHCNSYCDGFWTDITRTFWIGEPSRDARAAHQAVLTASEKAKAAVVPGIRASDVDRAAREVMSSHGYGPAFRHATGHGVGFAAIDHDAQPRIHPQSGDILHPGMIFNIEPAV
jgi:Xaa-Pro aminopeptidase